MAENISFEKIEEVMNDHFPLTDSIDWHNIEIEFMSCIPFAAASKLIQDVADACFTDDGDYMPEVMNFALRAGVIGLYTNIELPTDADAMNRLLFGTDLWDRVTLVIDEAQLGMIEQSINRRIKARLDTNKAEFERGVRQVLDGMAQLADQMNGLFDGVSNDDLKNMITAIGENGIDEGKLVQAVVAEQNKTRDNVVEFPAAAEEPDEEK